MPRYSLVIPFFNEAGNPEPLLSAAAHEFDELGAAWEAVLVDDGSTDGTSEELDSLATTRREIRVIHLHRNLGQAAALLTGLHAARASIIITMDGDGQNDPREIPKLLSAYEHTGAHLVCGWRRERHDSALRRLMSGVANAVRRRLLRDQVHDSGCQLRAFRSEIVDAFLPVRLMQSFIPAMAVAAGFRVAEIPVKHIARTRGTSKYGLGNLWWRPCVDMLALWWLLRRRIPPIDVLQ